MASRFVAPSAPQPPLFQRESAENGGAVGQARLGERKVAKIALFLSLLVVACKLLHSYRHELYSVVYEDRLRKQEFTIDGREFLTYTRDTVSRLHILLKPFLWGFGVAVFSWCIVYLDSKKPGVIPPSPISPSKHRTTPRREFHLNYAIAIINGVLVFFLLLSQTIVPESHS